ncbi:MAG TPA: TetR/AcrR family transcriptional regulator [Nocardioides sp.]|nr:TetR/AcrR family transcriptional regulator [Nocardioides sp.]
MQTRRLLLDVGVRILDQKGIAALTASAVTRAAHLSPGTFYRYFNDKDELLTVLRDEAVHAVNDDLMVSVVDVLDLELEPALRHVVSTLVDGLERHHGVMQAMVSQAPSGTDANLMPEIEANLHQLASLLPRRHRRDLPPDELEGVVFMLMGVLVSMCLRIALQRPAGVAREQLIDLTVAMVAVGLTAPRADRLDP